MFAKPQDSNFSKTIAKELEIPDPDKTKAEEVINGDRGTTTDNREGCQQDIS